MRIAICLLLLICSLWATFTIYTVVGSQRTYKSDLIELCKIKYGIFSIDEWKIILAEIITRKIEEFDLQGEDREVMRGKIEVFLWDAVNEIEEEFDDENNSTPIEKNVFEWASQQLRGGVSDFIDVFGTIRRKIPDITDNVLNFLDKKENRENLKRFILKQITEYADKTFAETDYTSHDQITAKYGGGDRLIAKAELISAIDVQKAQTYLYLLIIIIVFIGVVLITLLAGKIAPMEIILLSLVSLIFLALGLTLPMIEIDARIEQFNFQLLGEPVSFTDQILYYKSKSILEMVNLLITQEKIEIVSVGLLVLAFSVVFPLLKLLATGLYCMSQQMKDVRLVRFLVFRTGKWSMADVLVVAILMAYIGFDGIITDQLKQLSGISSTVDIFTTNQSNLQLGFFFFTGFVLLSLLISHRMQFGVERDSRQVS